MPFLRIEHRVDHHFHSDSETHAQLAQILAGQVRAESAFNNLTTFILKELSKMSAELDLVKAEVAENTTVIGSAIALINGLADQIRDLKDDPVALAALAAELDASSNALGAAVAANTPTPPPTGEETTSG